LRKRPRAEDREDAAGPGAKPVERHLGGRFPDFLGDLNHDLRDGQVALREIFQMRRFV